DRMKHPVDPQPHQGLFALGLDVNVGGSIVESVAKQVIHRLDDRLVRRLELLLSTEGEKLFEVLNLWTAAEVIRRPSQRLLESVNALARLENVALGAEDRPHRRAA